MRFSVHLDEAMPLELHFVHVARSRICNLIDEDFRLALHAPYRPSLVGPDLPCPEVALFQFAFAAWRPLKQCLKGWR
jgi:hypothetical protein